MRIQHNIMAMNAYRNYNTNTSALSKNLEKLSSGYKINRAGDDAAGLAISEKMRAQITGLNAAQKNVKDGVSLVKTAEGAMQEIQDMLNRMDYLATQSANGTYQDAVDRENLQKEVDALKTEINRIADSANFNGIKLLDGKLGLNTDSFEITSANAVAATTGKVDISSLLPAEGTSPSALHLETASANASTPGFTVDLGTLAATGSKQNDTITVTVAGNSYTLTAANDGDFDTTNGIATALVAAMKKDDSPNGVQADGTAAATGKPAVGIKIGNAAYTVGAAANGAIAFTYMGRYTDPTDLGTFVAETTFAGSEGEATTINSNLGFAVEFTGNTGTGKVGGNVVHDATKVAQANAAVNASLAGIDLKLDATVVKNNNVLEIDGKKFQFKTSATGFTKADGVDDANVIDLTAEKEANWIHAAADKLSNIAEFDGANGRKWKIGVENGMTIHIEQTKKSDAGSELKEYSDLTSKIKVNGKAEPAKNAGTTINIKTPGKVAEGDGLTIGEGKNAVRYVFTKDANKTDTADTKYVQFSNGGADAAANLKTKLADAGLTAEIDGNKVTIRAASATDAAPVVRGKGLTLQIGDTSDSYNQMNVAVGDMHVTAMGTKGGDSIFDIDISTQTGAADAVQTVKDAINYVSSVRGDLGAVQNRLEHTANNLSVMSENIQDAESTIRDTDIAEEMMAYTKNNILVQSAQAMLAQANQVPQGVLQLLG